tara:strand:+ start:2168 stop:2812 length:645 start_codon:yes stop_codon:yes gene_type:complete
MSEETQIIVNDIKKTSLKSFLLNNKKLIVTLFLIILLALFASFFYIDHKKDQKVKISEQYNFAVISYNKDNPGTSILKMKDIINIKDPTYSPLALYFLLDNNLLSNKDEVNEYFDLLIKEVKLEKEVKNLIIFKKGLYNSDSANEDVLLKIFDPLINSENLWESHALYILAEYFYSKNEMQKSKEFFEKILKLENSNTQIKLEAQKRLQRDFSV